MKNVLHDVPNTPDTPPEMKAKDNPDYCNRCEFLSVIFDNNANLTQWLCDLNPGILMGSSINDRPLRCNMFKEWKGKRVLIHAKTGFKIMVFKIKNMPSGELE